MNSLQQGIQFARRGQNSEAEKYFQKAIDITPAIVADLIEVLKREKIQYVVAPYEADAQLVYLEKNNVISAIITEDSDLLVFGARVLLTKMDDQGRCIAVERSNFKNCTELVLSDITDAQLRAIAMFSGCDYSNGIPRIGLKKAHYYVRKYVTAERALRCIRCDGFDIPEGFEQELEQGEITFQYQRVYSITEKKLVHLNDPPMKLSPEAEIYVGQNVDDEICQGVAVGRLDPFTKNPISTKPMPTVALSTKTVQITPSTANRVSLPVSKSATKITSFFTPVSSKPKSTQRSSSLYTSSTPVVFQRSTQRNAVSDVLPSSTPSTVHRSLVRKRADRFLDTSDNDTDSDASFTALSQATIRDSISSTDSGVTIGNFAVDTASAHQTQFVSKFFSAVTSRSSTMEEQIDGGFSESESDGEFDSLIPSKANSLSNKPLHIIKPAHSAKKSSNIWARGSKVVFQKTNDNVTTSLSSLQQEKIQHLQTFAYSSATTRQSSVVKTPHSPRVLIPNTSQRSATRRTNAEIGPVTIPRTPVGASRSAGLDRSRNLIDSDSDSEAESSEVETPEHMRVNSSLGLREDVNNASHLVSPTRGAANKKVRVSTSTSHSIYATSANDSRPMHFSQEPLFSISEKLAHFSYTPSK